MLHKKKFVSTGDIASISSQICLDKNIFKKIRKKDIIFVGPENFLETAAKILKKDININYVNKTKKIENNKLNYFSTKDKLNYKSVLSGKIVKGNGRISFNSLRAAYELAKKYKGVLITLPINKKSWEIDNIKYKGHTYFLESKSKNKFSVMSFFSEKLKIALVTHHIPLRKVAAKLTSDKINKTIEIFSIYLKKYLKKPKVKIAILGINPHSGDDGVIGTEELNLKKKIKWNSKKYSLDGFFVADTFFTGKYKEYDGIIALYHDQGLIPFKMLSFDKGVNVTLNSDIIRTSVDHGTAYDIVRTDKVKIDSFINAVSIAERFL